ncbi:conserved hypothetical protein [Coccidioides posadasii str. Silveira]|uniref:Uncharacterized protein n=1 Tax=Coccidioides posadasii (strain RMSCC 757 / Silveira) TaxID=443226 RepID=E9D0L5_COCPS|nr:conserved hypothetical protein [Coccidioides posadasii str. Silveira]
MSFDATSMVDLFQVVEDLTCLRSCCRRCLWARNEFPEHQLEREAMGSCSALGGDKEGSRCDRRNWKFDASLREEKCFGEEVVGRRDNEEVFCTKRKRNMGMEEEGGSVVSGGVLLRCGGWYDRMRLMTGGRLFSSPPGLRSSESRHADIHTDNKARSGAPKPTRAHSSLWGSLPAKAWPIFMSHDQAFSGQCKAVHFESFARTDKKLVKGYTGQLFDQKTKTARLKRKLYWCLNVQHPGLDQKDRSIPHFSGYLLPLGRVVQVEDGFIAFAKKYKELLHRYSDFLRLKLPVTSHNLRDLLATSGSPDMCFYTNAQDGVNSETQNPRNAQFSALFNTLDAALHVHPDQYHVGFPRLLGAIGFVRKRPCRGSGQSCRENGVAL